MLRVNVRCVRSLLHYRPQAISGIGAQGGRIVPVESTMHPDNPHGR